MSDPNEPPYPQYPNPQQPPNPGYPPPSQPRGPRLSERMGARAVRRPEPRLGVSLAGVGIGLAVIGVIVWGGDFLTSGGGGFGEGGGSSDSRRVLGVVLSLIVVAAGYVLAIARRRGPLATAGVAASALGVPVLFGFLTFDAAGGGDSGLPFSLDAIVLASVFIWVVSYFLVAGAQGHAFYVGLATTTFWVYMLDKSSPDTFSGAAIFSAFDPFGVGDSFEPDWGTIAGLSLTFGVVYYLIGFLVDRAGRPGPAVPFMVSGFLAVATGIATASVDLHAIGTGVLLIVTGLLLGAFGARGARRFTTWVWSAGVALGVIVIIGKLADDNAAAAGVSLIASGAVVVLVGHLVFRALLEPDDLTPTGSGLAPRG